MKYIMENWRSYLTEDEQFSAMGLHLSNEQLNIDSITLEPRITRQGRGGSYLGFYLVRLQGDQDKDLKLCEKAFREYVTDKSKPYYLYVVGIQCKESERLATKNVIGATKINKQKYNALLEKGIKLIDTGKLGIPTPEFVILDKSVIKSFKQHKFNPGEDPCGVLKK